MVKIFLWDTNNWSIYKKRPGPTLCTPSQHYAPHPNWTPQYPLAVSLLIRSTLPPSPVAHPAPTGQRPAANSSCCSSASGGGATKAAGVVPRPAGSPHLRWAHGGVRLYLLSFASSWPLLAIKFLIVIDAIWISFVADQLCPVFLNYPPRSSAQICRFLCWFEILELCSVDMAWFR
jgi:hypothetical protein